jgi:virulence-associated protein VagC
MKKQLLILTTLLIASLGYSQTTFVNNFITYTVTSTTANIVEITDYNIAGGTNVTIPSSVSFNSINHTITRINDNAFINKGLTSVTFTIPSNVTSIGVSAFLNNNITSITIPNSVISIGSEAFGENLLTNVTLGNSLAVIGLDAFAFNQIGNISFPSSLMNIQSGAFRNNLLTNVTIPSTITTLGNSVFRNNQLLSATFENALTTIPGDLFLNNQLQSITIPPTVTNIGAGAFQNNQLTSIIWYNNISIIESAAFRNNQLTSVTIPNAVTTMGTRVFLDNPLTSVTSLCLTPPTISTGGTIDTFAAIRTGIHLHIPPGTLSAYTNASWTGFNPVTQDATLSTSSFELANDIKLITSSETIKIVTSNHIKLENYTMYTMSGAIIASGNSSEISTSFFARGIYIIKLNFDKGSVVKKISVN